MTVSTVVERLVDMFPLITNTPKPISALPYTPRAIQDAQLPVVLIETGAAQYDIVSYSEEMVAENRVYRLRLYVFKATLGTPGLSEETVRPYIDVIRDYFLARPGLELDTDVPPKGIVARAVLQSDTGVVVLQYGEPFVGVEFQLSVTEIKTIGYTGG